MTRAVAAILGVLLFVNLLAVGAGFIISAAVLEHAVLDNRSQGDGNRAVLCAIAKSRGIGPSVIGRYCP